MFTNRQKALLKRAQREAELSDNDYREALELVTGCRSSTDERLTDRDLDKLLAYFEAIYWRAVDAALLQRDGSAVAVFRQRVFWATRNTASETSRDRFTGSRAGAEIQELEAALAALGFGAGYCAVIRQNVSKGRQDDRARHLYRAALERTLTAKRHVAERAQSAENPF